jgi:hypothetical protein
LSIDPALPELFKSLQELQSAFPENYEFFGFRERDRVSGAYRLHPFLPSFDQISQFNIVARPNEKAGKIPTMSAGESTRQPMSGGRPLLRIRLIRTVEGRPLGGGPASENSFAIISSTRCQLSLPVLFAINSTSCASDVAH